MVTLEQVEKLRKYGNVTYDQAKKALEDAEGDMLEAIIILEKQNLIEQPVNGGFHKTKNEEEAKEGFQGKKGNGSNSKENDGASFSELMGRFFKWSNRMIRKGNINHFEVIKDGTKVITFPVTVLVFLLLFMFPVVLPAMVIGLFFGYKYRFIGPDLGKDNVNRAMDSVADAAENFKKEMKSEKSDGENSNN